MAITVVWSSLPAAAQVGSEYESAIREALGAQGAGQYQHAHAHFARAHALDPSARTLRGMGVASFQAGELIRSVGELEAALSHPNKPLDPALAEAVRSLIARARSQLAAVVLEVTPSDARVRVDDAAEDHDVSEELLLLPGEHRLRLVAPSFVGQDLGFEARAGTRQRLRITLAPEQLTVVPPLRSAVAPAPRVDPQPAVAPTPRIWRIASLSALAVSAAAAASALGVYYGIGQRRVREIAAECADLPAQGCTEAELDVRTRKAGLRRLAKVSTALWITAGTAGAAGSLLLVLSLNPRVVGRLPFSDSSGRTADISVGLNGRF